MFPSGKKRKKGKNEESGTIILCGLIIPYETMNKIMSYLEHNCKLITSVGLVNRLFYDLVLRTWKNVILDSKSFSKINNAIFPSISSLTFKNLLRKDVKKLFNKLVPPQQLKELHFKCSVSQIDSTLKILEEIRRKLEKKGHVTPFGIEVIDFPDKYGFRKKIVHIDFARLFPNLKSITNGSCLNFSNSKSLKNVTLHNGGKKREQNFEVLPKSISSLVVHEHENIFPHLQKFGRFKKLKELVIFCDHIVRANVIGINVPIDINFPHFGLPERRFDFSFLSELHDLQKFVLYTVYTETSDDRQTTPKFIFPTSKKSLKSITICNLTLEPIMFILDNYSSTVENMSITFEVSKHRHVYAYACRAKERVDDAIKICQTFFKKTIPGIKKNAFVRFEGRDQKDRKGFWKLLVKIKFKKVTGVCTIEVLDEEKNLYEVHLNLVHRAIQLCLENRGKEIRELHIISNVATSFLEEVVGLEMLDMFEEANMKSMFYGSSIDVICRKFK